MTDAEINRAVAEARGQNVGLAASLWTDEDWATSDSPTQRNAVGILNPGFKPGSMSPPAWPLPDVVNDPIARDALLSDMGADGEMVYIFTFKNDTTVRYQGLSTQDALLGRALALAFLKAKGRSDV